MPKSKCQMEIAEKGFNFQFRLFYSFFQFIFLSFTHELFILAPDLHFFLHFSRSLTAKSTRLGLLGRPILSIVPRLLIIASY